MKSKLKRTLYAGLLVITVCLSSCQKNPKQNSVVSKNDGAFDANLVQSAKEDKKPDATQSIRYSEEFSSTDGSVEFRMYIDADVFDGNWPVVEVKPHYLTEDDAQRVAIALFGNVDFYESEPRLAPVYSKQEMQENIKRWSQYTNQKSLRELYGDYGGNLEYAETVIKNYIENYTALCEEADENYMHETCQWKFKKESYYWEAAADLEGQPLENENDAIQATFQNGNIKYEFSASTRDKDDFKINNICAYLSSGDSPYSIDERIYRAQLCRTKEPTESQLEEVKVNAESMLDQMQLGSWLIDKCYVDTKYYDDVPEYTICIKAVPVLNGIPALRRPQLANLKSDEAYASNYYLTDAEFEFSANGDLVSFWMYSPIDVSNIVNDNVAVYGSDALLEKAKNCLELSDYYGYGFPGSLDSLDQDVGCTVNVMNMDMNLTRVKVPNSDESYYYIPALTLVGNIEYYGKDNGTVYYCAENVTLLVMNAVDGSIINITNE